MNLIGAVIRQAIYDYQFYGEMIEKKSYGWRKRKDIKQAEYLKDSAEAYLLNQNRLEEWLEMTGLDRHVSIHYIRHVAKNVSIIGKRKLESVPKTPDEQEIFTEH